MLAAWNVLVLDGGRECITISECFLSEDLGLPQLPHQPLQLGHLLPRRLRQEDL